MPTPTVDIPGWAAPADDWVDHEVVTRALTGYPHPGRKLTRAERLIVTRHVLAQGYGATQLAKHLHLNGHTCAALIAEARAEQDQTP